MAYKQLGLMDLPKEELEKQFNEAFDFLEEVRNKRVFEQVTEREKTYIQADTHGERRVLVHCILGKSRSPAIVMGMHLPFFSSY